MVSTTTETIANSRSLEAELATEEVSTDPSIEANQRAVQLHTEAAKWRRQADDEKRALHHEAYARVHSRLVARLQDEPGEEDQ